MPEEVRSIFNQLFSSFIMHRRIPWTELFSCTITSEASSLTLSEVENIFAAWRLVLKKMYLSRRIICFSGIDPLTPWNGLAGSFQCQWPFPKLRWFLKFQSYKILYDTARLWNIMEKCWAWSRYLSAGDVMYILLFFGQVCRRIIGPGGENMKRLEPQISCGLDVWKN